MSFDEKFFTSGEVFLKLASVKNKHELLNLKAEFNNFTQGLFKNMKALNLEQKKAEGEKINTLKTKFEEEFARAMEQLKVAEIEEKLAKQGVDISLHSFHNNFGSLNPISVVMDELVTIMQKYGFTFIKGPEIETNYFNFDALNISKNHPAREMHDTFYLNCLDENSENFLLRTHTSNTQIRGMSGKQPPFAFVYMGRTYRCDSDRTHSPMFNQFECLYVDEGVNMGNLIWMLERMLGEFYKGIDVKIRLRPSFFPFTEPSVEIDVNLGKGFLEVLGGGMVHPTLLERCGIDSKKYSGFAFGAGVERLAMLKYGIEDLRDFFNSKRKWNESYGFRV